MTTVAARLSQKELDYLSEIATKNKMYKGETKDLSLGKAMKELVKWCQLHQVDISKKHDDINNEMKRMIEQIHIAIPNLMYLSRVQTLLATDEISDETIKQVMHQSVDYLNKVCGDFQNVQYEQVQFSINDIGLKLMPINKDKSQWKLP